jgi:OOP family OmpA-OmpF porin
MNYTFKKALLLIPAVLLAASCFGQIADTTVVNSNYVTPFSPGSAYRTWSVGVHAGLMTTFNVFTSNDRLDFTVPNNQYGYGGYIKKQISSSYGIQLDFLYGTLNGDNAQPDSAGKSPFKSFHTTVNYAVDLSSNITVGNISFRFMKSVIQPFITVGAGIMNYKPTVTTSAGVERNYVVNGGNDVLNEFYVPLGLGLKFNVAKGVNIELGYQVNFVYSDNIDGYKWGTTNDKYSYGHVGLEIAIGKRSKPQLAVHNPVLSMRNEYQAGIGNLSGKMAGMQTQLDTEKAHNQALQQQVAASNALIAKLTTDSDGDGVADFFDKCPNTPAGTKVDGSGCPLPVPPKIEEPIFITEADRMVVNEVVHNLVFESGKAVISTRSYPSLEKLAKILVDKKIHLKLAGYTDSRGSALANLKLSRARAEAIKTFLTGKGADESLIQTEGYGKAHPLASNKTAKGRAINRRVEFSLY